MISDGGAEIVDPKQVLVLMAHQELLPLTLTEELEQQPLFVPMGLGSSKQDQLAKNK
jgi:hypothetical protein